MPDSLPEPGKNLITAQDLDRLAKRAFGSVVDPKGQPVTPQDEPQVLDELTKFCQQQQASEQEKDTSSQGEDSSKFDRT